MFPTSRAHYRRLLRLPVLLTSLSTRLTISGDKGWSVLSCGALFLGIWSRARSAWYHQQGEKRETGVGAHLDGKSDRMFDSKVLLEGIVDRDLIKVGVGGIGDDVGVGQAHDRVARGAVLGVWYFGMLWAGGRGQGGSRQGVAKNGARGAGNMVP